jgi:hypothetical protein
MHGREPALFAQVEEELTLPILLDKLLPTQMLAGNADETDPLCVKWALRV